MPMEGRRRTLLDEDRQNNFRESLIKWYYINQRYMPWRNTDDPYAIWISEIMLQQTRVQQVYTYYKNFMTQFPSVEALGRAPLEKVLKAWEGLGYYARARNIHKTANQILTIYDGNFPDDPKLISKLPGIGEYTTAAIMSIAFGKDFAAIDGNVIRLLSRLFLINEDIANTQTKKTMVTLANLLLYKGRAGDFNQAMMELGATVCTPRKPLCNTCPVKKHCLAQDLLQDPSILPIKKPVKQKPHQIIVVGIIRKNDKVLIVRRPTDGLLGGLWEFPGGATKGNIKKENFLRDEINRTLEIDIRVDKSLATIKHAYTHFKITLQGFYSTYLGGKTESYKNEYRWIRLEALKDYPFPRAHTRLIDAIMNQSKE